MGDKIRQLIKESDFNVSEIEFLLGYSHATFWRRLHNNNLAINDFMELVTILDLSDEQILDVLKSN